MIEGAGWGRGWLIAAGLSVALHGAAVAALIWQPGHSASPPPPLGELRLDLVGPAPTDQTSMTQPLTSLSEVEGEQAAPPSDDPPMPVTDLLLTPTTVGSLAVAGTPVLPDQAAIQPDVPLPALDEDAPPPDPLIADLLDRIRQRLTEPCLLALPSRLGEDQVQLNVMAADDRRISLLMHDLTQGLAADITEQPTLLDRRQCPALDFARRDPGYPLPGIALQLDAQDIASGGNLGGRLTGTAGFHTTLLLIDDNGVVHDLRRFLVGSVAGSRFDIPIARDGQVRDTHQIIMALATPNRLQTIPRLNGTSAEDFFAGITQEVGGQLRVGVAAVYVR
ncbi:MAG: hypothetical protein Q4G24_15400 [Paracoccus sp. (in: a-proteobacteria)]|uniref:hypothetical protein n=1 Tax=Paracoccus sp. TaxID=267 RepID=UPI0026DF13AE|nr:hypothetical protein [Paracoccus sp. (in: a-proteobacteria)]MDO5622834.1 hypothetical protein [Paracoccus sp. (in: a-proteobacteria)]